jgi:hypothetical protein
VFADALVPRRAVARVAPFPDTSTGLQASRVAARCDPVTWHVPRAALTAMVIVSPNRTVNRIRQIARQPSKSAIFRDIATRANEARSDSIHRDA